MPSPPSSPQVDVAYSAETHGCTYLLDDAGICRRVVLRGANLKEASLARRCVGAQYVATLDLASERGLVQMPQPGAPLLFARIDDGRVSLVKTAPLRRWVDHTFRTPHEVTTARYGTKPPELGAADDPHDFVAAAPPPPPRRAARPAPPPPAAERAVAPGDDDYLPQDDNTLRRPDKAAPAEAVPLPRASAPGDSDFEEEILTVFADRRTLFDEQAPPETDEVEVEDVDESPTKFISRGIPGVGSRKKGMLPKRR